MGESTFKPLCEDIPYKLLKYDTPECDQDFLSPESECNELSNWNAPTSPDEDCFTFEEFSKFNLLINDNDLWRFSSKFESISSPGNYAQNPHSYIIKTGDIAPQLHRFNFKDHIADKEQNQLHDHKEIWIKGLGLDEKGLPIENPESRLIITPQLTQTNFSVAGHDFRVYQIKFGFLDTAGRTNSLVSRSVSASLPDGTTFIAGGLPQLYNPDADNPTENSFVFELDQPILRVTDPQGEQTLYSKQELLDQIGENRGLVLSNIDDSLIRAFVHTLSLATEELLKVDFVFDRLLVNTFGDPLSVKMSIDEINNTQNIELKSDNLDIKFDLQRTHGFGNIAIYEPDQTNRRVRALNDLADTNSNSENYLKVKRSVFSSFTNLLNKPGVEIFSGFSDMGAGFKRSDHGWRWVRGDEKVDTTNGNIQSVSFQIAGDMGRGAPSQKGSAWIVVNNQEHYVDGTITYTYSNPQDPLSDSFDVEFVSDDGKLSIHQTNTPLKSTYKTSATEPSLIEKAASIFTAENIRNFFKDRLVAGQLQRQAENPDIAPDEDGIELLLTLIDGGYELYKICKSFERNNFHQTKYGEAVVEDNSTEVVFFSIDFKRAMFESKTTINLNGETIELEKAIISHENAWSSKRLVSSHFSTDTDLTSYYDLDEEVTMSFEDFKREWKNHTRIRVSIPDNYPTPPRPEDETTCLYAPDENENSSPLIKKLYFLKEQAKALELLTPESALAFNQGIPDPCFVEPKPDQTIEYYHTEDTAYYADIYYPKENQPSRGTILINHGGGFIMGGPDSTHAQMFGGNFQKLGYTVIIPGLPHVGNLKAKAFDETKVIDHQLEAVAELLNNKLVPYDIDLSDITVISFSAGAYFANQLGRAVQASQDNSLANLNYPELYASELYPSELYPEPINYYELTSDDRLITNPNVSIGAMFNFHENGSVIEGSEAKYGFGRFAIDDDPNRYLEPFQGELFHIAAGGDVLMNDFQQLVACARDLQDGARNTHCVEVEGMPHGFGNDYFGKYSNAMIDFIISVIEEKDSKEQTLAIFKDFEPPQDNKKVPKITDEDGVASAKTY